MNEQLQKFARDTLKAGLAQLPTHNHRIFKLMYSHKNLDADINDVVEEIPEDKLDWAMKQVENSLKEEEQAKEEG